LKNQLTLPKLFQTDKTACGVRCSSLQHIQTNKNPTHHPHSNRSISDHAGKLRQLGDNDYEKKKQRSLLRTYWGHTTTL
jgi:hypothetical protein